MRIIMRQKLGVYDAMSRIMADHIGGSQVEERTIDALAKEGWFDGLDDEASLDLIYAVRHKMETLSH